MGNDVGLKTDSYYEKNDIPTLVSFDVLFGFNYECFSGSNRF